MDIEPNKEEFQELWPINDEIAARAAGYLLSQGFEVRTSPAVMAYDASIPLPDFTMLRVKGDIALADKKLRQWCFAPERLNFQEKPLFDGSIEELVLIGQNEFGITNKRDKKPVIGTFGIGQCITVLGYEPNKGIAFVGHFDALTDIEETRSSFLYQLSKAGDLPQEYQVHLIGGDCKNDQQFAERIIPKIQIRRDISFEVIEKDLAGLEERGCISRSAGIDTRTGMLYSFARNHLKDYKIDLKNFAQKVGSPARLVYKPDN